MIDHLVLWGTHMLLKPGGIDVYYIDESHDRHLFIATAIRIPFLRNDCGTWHIVWPDHLAQAKTWRRDIKSCISIPTTKELHGVKLLSGRGNYLKGKYNFKRKQALEAYQYILSTMNFLPAESVLSSSAGRGKSLYGRQRIEAAMYALFQRMRRQCLKNETNAITFFDQGHPEYRHLYRMAQVYLPTGSALGGWGNGASRNMPMDMFTKDGNEKNSKDCYFTQAADLIAYAAFIKLKAESGVLTDWQQDIGAGKLYDSIPLQKLNTKVSSVAPRDAIVRLR